MMTEKQRPVVAPMEVRPKAKRRTFSAEFKRRVLAEVDACTKPGEVGPISSEKARFAPVPDPGPWRGSPPPDLPTAPMRRSAFSFCVRSSSSALQSSVRSPGLPFAQVRLPSGRPVFPSPRFVFLLAARSSFLAARSSFLAARLPFGRPVFLSPRFVFLLSARSSLRPGSSSFCPLGLPFAQARLPSGRPVFPLPRLVFLPFGQVRLPFWPPGLPFAQVRLPFGRPVS